VRFKQKPFSHWTTGEDENHVAIFVEAARSNLAGTALRNVNLRTGNHHHGHKHQ
jgi:hypothetical protein